jgi:hypothetical protein
MHHWKVACAKSGETLLAEARDYETKVRQNAAMRIKSLRPIA